MKKIWKFLIAFVVGLGIFCSAVYWQSLSTPAFSREATFTETSAPAVESHLGKVRRDKAALRAFLRQMPKGAELHSHLSGTASPDRLLELALQSKRYRYFVRVPNQTSAPDDPKAYAFVALQREAPIPQDEKATFVPVAKLLNPQTDAQRQQLAAYRRAMTIAEDEPNPNAVFFKAIFGRNDTVTGDTEIVPLMLADVVEQAGRDRLSYVEIMFSPFPKDLHASDAEENKLLNLTSAREYLSSLLAAVERANEKYPSSERVEVRFLLSFPRTRPKLFTQLPIAFELASASDAVGQAIAGINLVGNEYSDDPKIGQEIASPSAIDEFILSLRRIYPTVRLSMHAGESNKWDWHIRDSILMGAERIGHGVNLALSPQPNPPEAVLMRRHDISIEACLTSNHLLLKVPFERHPFLNYLRAGIPVSLSTDNTGVFGIDMTEEFARAVESHPDLSWKELKQMARFSLEHAFVSEDIKAKLISRWEEQMRVFEASIK